MKIILAPMEGLTDVHMRHILTQMAGQTGFDWCVTEFIRITQQLLLPKAFYHKAPLFFQLLILFALLDLAR